MNQTPAYLRVYASGRWGARRVRVSECPVVMRAEHLYDQLIKDGRPPRPGASGESIYTISDKKRGDTQYRASWEVRANRVWAFGRAFYVCPRCEKRATRLYIPTLGSRPECRECWGLTYATRTMGNYSRRGCGLLAAFGLTSRDWTMMETVERRAEARKAARRRYAARALQTRCAKQRA